MDGYSTHCVAHARALPTFVLTVAVTVTACGTPRPPLPDMDGSTLDVVAHDASDVPSEKPQCTATAPDWGRGGEWMFPGSDCLECHRSGGSAARHPFTIAGTVFRTATCPEGVRDVTVHVRDALGTELRLRTNEVGNFYSSAVLQPPYRLAIEYQGVFRQMLRRPDTGSCGSCHRADNGIGYVSLTD